MGTSPGSAVSGFPNPCVSSAPAHAADEISQRGQAALLQQYGDADSRACTTQLTGMNLGALAPLVGGVYCFTSSAQLNGTLVLDGAGDETSQWIFKMIGGLTTASDSAVSLINSAQAANVYWNVGSSTTIGQGSRFVGDLATRASITLGSMATGNVLCWLVYICLQSDCSAVVGRLLALTGAVTIANGGSVSMSKGGCSHSMAAPTTTTTTATTTTITSMADSLTAATTNDVVSITLATLAVIANSLLYIL